MTIVYDPARTSQTSEPAAVEEHDLSSAILPMEDRTTLQQLSQYSPEEDLRVVESLAHDFLKENSARYAAGHGGRMTVGEANLAMFMHAMPTLQDYLLQSLANVSTLGMGPQNFLKIEDLIPGYGALTGAAVEMAGYETNEDRMRAENTVGIPLHGSPLYWHIPEPERQK